jgi:hypothetical protein
MIINEHFFGSVTFYCDHFGGRDVYFDVDPWAIELEESRSILRIRIADQGLDERAAKNWAAERCLLGVVQDLTTKKARCFAHITLFRGIDQFFFEYSYGKSFSMWRDRQDSNFVVIELPICVISQAQFEACLTIYSLKTVKRWLPTAPGYF